MTNAAAGEGFNPPLRLVVRPWAVNVLGAIYAPGITATLVVTRVFDLWPAARAC